MNKEDSWTQAIRSKPFRLHLSISGMGAVLLISFLPYFFNDVLLNKPGVLLNDFILNLLEPRDWSWIIFALIYSSIFITVLSNYSRPYVILLGIEAYLAVNLVRIITLYSITLEPPQGIIPLIDPLITKVAYGNTVYLKDLFFSGHVSTLFLLFLIETNKLRKGLLIFSTGVVAILIVWQHVHYSIDVLFAPVVVWFVYYIIQKIHNRQFANPNELKLDE